MGLCWFKEGQQEGWINKWMSPDCANYHGVDWVEVDLRCEAQWACKAMVLAEVVEQEVVEQEVMEQEVLEKREDLETGFRNELRTFVGTAVS